MSRRPASILEEIEEVLDEREEGRAGGLHPAGKVSCAGERSVSSKRLFRPRMPLSGVRNSWLTVARKRDLARLAASARSRASFRLR